MTPNEGITGILFNDFGIPLIFIEIIVNMLLFTTILDIKSPPKRKHIYVLVSFIVSCIINFLFDKPVSSYINMITYPIIIYFVFNTSVLKSIFAELIPFKFTWILAIVGANLKIAETIIANEAISLFGSV